MSTRASRIAFFLIFGLTAYLFYRTLAPIFLWVGVGAFCAILTYGPFTRLANALRGRRHLAAALCTAGVMLVVVTPLAVTGWAVVSEGLDLASRVQAEDSLQRTGEDGWPKFVPESWRHSLNRVREVVPLDRERVRAMTVEIARRASGVLSNVLTGATAAGIGIFLWVLSLFYFYVDGERWLTGVLRLVPLDERHSVSFFREFRSVAHAVFFGNIVTSLAQGVLGGLAFLIVGTPGAVLWGALIAIAGILPLVGAVLVWGPAAIWLFTQGRPGAAIFMLVWGALVVGTVDNILRPLLTKGQLQMHPLLVFLSIFGGLSAFGFAGVFLGPLFAALFLAALRIYAAEFPPPGREAPPLDMEEDELGAPAPH